MYQKMCKDIRQSKQTDSETDVEKQLSQNIADSRLSRLN